MTLLINRWVGFKLRRIGKWVESKVIRALIVEKDYACFLAVHRAEKEELIVDGRTNLLQIH